MGTARTLSWGQGEEGWGWRVEERGGEEGWVNGGEWRREGVKRGDEWRRGGVKRGGSGGERG